MSESARLQAFNLSFDLRFNVIIGSIIAFRAGFFFLRLLIKLDAGLVFDKTPAKKVKPL